MRLLANYAPKRARDSQGTLLGRLENPRLTPPSRMPRSSAMIAARVLQIGLPLSSTRRAMRGAHRESTTTPMGDVYRCLVMLSYS